MTDKRQILVIAPHADDETLGMGATIAKRARRGCEVTVAVMTGHGGGINPAGPPELWEKIRAEANAAAAALGVAPFRYFELPAVRLLDIPTHEPNGVVNALVRDVRPNELYLPFHNDMHRDHEVLARAGLVAARGYLTANYDLNLVAMYETPTETHLVPPSVAVPFVPNHYEDVTDTIAAKLAAWACYASQHQMGPTPRSPDALRALAAVRGADIGVEAAEAFVIVRQVSH
jgi:LmbE family N-acetylglucosaminyl deacetylase